MSTLCAVLLHALSILTLSSLIMGCGRHYIGPHFTDEEAEAQRGSVARVHKQWGQGSNPKPRLSAAISHSELWISLKQLMLCHKLKTFLSLQKCALSSL